MKKNALFALLLVGAFMLPNLGKSQVLISLLLGDKLNTGKVEFGIVAGMNLSNLNGLSTDVNNSFGLGMYFDYNISKNWVASAEINLKAQNGAKNISATDIAFPGEDSILARSINSKRIIDIIHVPITINYKLNSGLGFGAGFYSSIMHGSRDIISLKENGANITFEKSFTNQLKPLDFGLTGLIYYHFEGVPGMQIRVRLNYGLVDVYNDTSNLSANNVWVNVCAAVPIMIKF